MRCEPREIAGVVVRNTTQAVTAAILTLCADMRLLLSGS